MPAIRPKGVTPKQWRLAALYPRCETAYQALIEAGYAHKTASKTASNILDRPGIRRAREAQGLERADSARGLMGVGTKGLASAAADLDALDPRDRLAASFKAIELAHSIGENVEQVGDGNRFHERVRRACRLMARLTYLRLISTTSCVCSCHNQAPVAKERNDATI